MEALAEEQRCEQHDPRWPGSRRGHAYQRHRTRSMLDRPLDYEPTQEHNGAL